MKDTAGEPGKWGATAAHLTAGDRPHFPLPANCPVSPEYSGETSFYIKQV